SRSSLAHRDAHPADTLDLRLDHVAGLHWRDAGGRAGHQDIAGVQGIELARVLDQARHAGNHVSRARILALLAVDPALELEALRIADFVGGREAGAERGIAVDRLAPRRVLAAGYPHVEADHVAGDVPERAGRP